MPLLDATITSFAAYVEAGGGRGMEIALGASPDAVIDEVAKSGLRGRGGGGYPTGEKWRAIRSTGSGDRFAIANGAEGEPATFKDRWILRTNPYQVIEGLAIAAYAVGASTAYLGIKRAFAEEAASVLRALAEMRDAGVERQPLFFAPQDVVHRLERGTGGHRGHQISGDVIDGRVQAKCREHDVRPGSGRAPVLLRAGTADGNRQTFCVRPFQLRREARRVFRFEHLRRHLAVCPSQGTIGRAVGAAGEWPSRLVVNSTLPVDTRH